MAAPADAVSGDSLVPRVLTWWKGNGAEGDTNIVPRQSARCWFGWAELAAGLLSDGDGRPRVTPEARKAATSGQLLQHLRRETVRF